MRTEQHKRYCYVVLALCLFLDFSFILLHIVTSYQKSAYSDSILLLDTPYGLPELFQFLKYMFILTLIATYILKNKWKSYVALFILFLTFFMDDLFQLHNLVASYIATVFQLKESWGLKGQDLGYIIYILCLGVIVLSISWFGFFKTSNKTRNGYKTIMLLVFLFLFFGIIMDGVNHFMTYTYGPQILFTVIEEGGEMIALSLLVCYINSLGTHGKRNLIQK